MNFDTLEADVTKILPYHYTPGRDSISGITIHHMAGDLSIDDCYSVWTNREASAHYAIQSDGTIGQLVNDWDTAWACGHDWANRNTISIEHANNNSDPWTVYPAAIDSGAHLVAALCKGYGLGEPEWMVNVFPHNHWYATACPGELAGSQNAEYMEKAKKYYAEMTGGNYTPSIPQPKPEPTPSGIPELRYCVSTDPNGEYWLPEMVNHYDTGGSSDDFAGNGDPICWLAIDMPGWYQVRTQNSGWLPRVWGYDTSDLENGCAGDGSPILDVRCYYETQNPDETGWLAIEYQCADAGEDFLAPMRDLTDTAGSGDDFSGDGDNQPIVKFRGQIVEV